MRGNRTRFEFPEIRTSQHAPLEKYDSIGYATNDSILVDNLALPEKQKLAFHSNRSSLQSTKPNSNNSDLEEIEDDKEFVYFTQKKQPKAVFSKSVRVSPTRFGSDTKKQP